MSMLLFNVSMMCDRKIIASASPEVALGWEHTTSMRSVQDMNHKQFGLGSGHWPCRLCLSYPGPTGAAPWHSPPQICFQYSSTCLVLECLPPATARLIPQHRQCPHSIGQVLWPAM